ncbi:MAG: ornithine carbamoyltransferase [Trichoglossum hirsutum]|nr:MAG: ornithine carbamoyltransferase [Trichoglossum hirsutum]
MSPHFTLSTAMVLRSLVRTQKRFYSSPSVPLTSPLPPRHFLSIADVTPSELTTLVRNAQSYKHTIKSGSIPKSLQGRLTGKTIAMIFNKRSTRTRVSTEGAVVTMGGHPMFLGKDDIQLNVNESLYDTAVVLSSMVSCVVARVGPHSDITGLAKSSTVPIINALSDDYHPLQTIADVLTLHETVHSPPTPGRSPTPGLGLEGLKLAWVGDANNVLFDLAIGARKLGIDVSVASPKGHEIPKPMLEVIDQAGDGVENAGRLFETRVPEEALKGADVILTDTWVSMGQEAEKAQRLRAFEGFRVTSELAERGGAKKDWKFMHCLPRHQEEVSDEVFYSPRSLVFQEAENRLWAAIAAIEAFVANEGKIS